jgi:SAM-dependent methyltransferase
MEMIVIDQLASAAPFDEALYLESNPDVKTAVRLGHQPSGYAHFLRHGLAEGRKIRHSNVIVDAKARKRERIRGILDPGKAFTLINNPGGPAYCFLDDRLKEIYGVVDTDSVSGHGYDAAITALIEEEYKDGLLLDCGAGRRPVYYENVVNYEIVNYDSTDVIGVAEELPFKDNSFDAVISVAVLEHVRDPFKAASEIMRVLKRGGKLFCCVPFLQPLHGYPNHYYNMTHEGLANLFRRLKIVKQEVFPSTAPIWTLTWFLKSWQEGLHGAAKEEFLNLRVRDLIGDPPSYLGKRYVTELPDAKNFELASATILTAIKDY